MSSDWILCSTLQQADEYTVWSSFIMKMATIMFASTFEGFQQMTQLKHESQSYTLDAER
jgi:hypothetical protein